MLKLVDSSVLAFLSILLTFYALVPILSPVPPSKWLYDAENIKEAEHYGANATIAPVLVGMRNSTGQFDFTNRRSQNFTFYYMLHVFPSILWCILLPMQHVKSLRRRFQYLHRMSGYLTIFLSTILSISGILFPFFNLSYTNDFWHLHSLQLGPEKSKVTVLVWPSFQLQTSILGVITLGAGYKNLRSALRKDIREHRRWSIVYTHIGYTVPLHRFWTLLYQLIGTGLPVLPVILREWLSVPEEEKAIFSAEVAANAWAAAMGLISSFTLLRYNEAVFPKQKAKLT